MARKSDQKSRNTIYLVPLKPEKLNFTELNAAPTPILSTSLCNDQDQYADMHREYLEFADIEAENFLT